MNNKEKIKLHQLLNNLQEYNENSIVVFADYMVKKFGQFSFFIEQINAKFEKELAWSFIKQIMKKLNKDQKDRVIDYLEHIAINMDNVDLFEKVISIKPLDHRIFSYISHIYENNLTLSYIRTLPIDWGQLCKESKEKDSYVSGSSKLLLDFINNENGQHLKDNALMYAVWNCNIGRTKFWIENGSKIFSENHNTILSRNINPENSTQFANADKVRQELVKHYPSDKKNNDKWKEFIRRLVDSNNDHIQYELVSYIVDGKIDMNEIPEKKLINYLFLMEFEKAKEILEIKIKQGLEDTYINLLYKKAVLNASQEMIAFLFDKELNSDKYCSSKSFTDLTIGKDNIKGSEFNKKEIRDAAKYLRSLRLNIKLNKDLPIEEAIVKRRNKI